MGRRRQVALLVALALVWGASFLFVKVAVRRLAPATLITSRLGLATLTVLLVVPVRVGLRAALAEIRAHARWLVAVALVNTALPAWLLAWGETRIGPGLAAIIQAAVPVFNAAIAFGFFREVRVTGLRLVGVGLGFVGVALLVGVQPGGKVLGALAVVGMALCYALGGLLAGRHLAGVRPPVIAVATTAVAALAALPAGALEAPDHVPGWKATGAVVVLGVCGTALAYLLFFTLVVNAGAAYASLVMYLVPPVALAYGALFLGERVGAVALGGLALILAGVALGTGRLRPQRLLRRLASQQ